MKVWIGPHEYRVKQSDDLLFDADHGEMWGQIDYANRLILISPNCPPASRGEVVGHEVCHAWLKHFPVPHDEEQLCDFIGAIAWGLARDLEEQGGTAILATLGSQFRTLDAESLRVMNPTRPARAGTQCSVCEQAVGDASIVSGPPRRHASNRLPIVERRFYCAFCEEVQVWSEMATPGGLPSGVIVDKPSHLTGAEAAEFCRQHPRESGVRV